MGFDRNTVIGFLLLGVLFIGYFAYNNHYQQKYLAENKRIQDSIAVVKAKELAMQKPAIQRQQQIKDSLQAGDFKEVVTSEQLAYVENNVMRVTLTNKGGWIKMVELKKFNGPDGTLVKMGGTANDLFTYNVNSGNNQTVGVDKLTFNTPVINKSGDGTQTISYQAAASDGKTISHSFIIKPNDYLVDANISMVGADKLLSQQSLNLNWNVFARQQQKDVEYEKSQTELVYVTDGDYDFNRAAKGTTEEFTKPTNFIGIRQQFFNSTILSKTGFNSASASIVVPADTVKNEVGVLKTTARIQLPAGNTATVPLQLYYGPNDYKLLKSYDNQMHNIVNLGSGIYAFVKYINRWIVLPMFDLLVGLVGGKVGWAILLLTVFIRLITAPLTVPGYKNGAKMKILQPELKALKEKFGDDTQGYSVAQMKFMSEAGSSPLKGCLPGLLQIPIFFALFSFFNSNILLRGQPFFWADDLSKYDSILTLPFNIPFYGDHVSLFTITACLTSFLISWYGMSNANVDQSNPMLKYMPYIFPVLMLFFFNRQPAALTWYYTVSNTVALLIQVFIRNFVIDHDKLMAQIAANRSKPKTKSKWQEKIEAMQESQRKMQEMQAKPKGR
jgi:YidC/Oxa1 family membrane protein insertase